MNPKPKRTGRTTAKPKILLVGDLILDHFVNGEVDRISPEAPIPVLDVQSEKFQLGGVGNVAANVVALGGQAIITGMVGKDGPSRTLRAQLKQARIREGAVIVDPKRPTIQKTRHTSRVHQILRVDRESRDPIPSRLQDQVLRKVPTLVREADLVILSDYAKGFLTRPIIQAVVREARKAKKRVLVDPKGKDFSRYRGVSILTPNKGEAEAATGVSITDKASLTRAAKKMIKEQGLEVALITLGKEGVYYRTRKGEEKTIPTEARAVFDVTGAGDTVLSCLAVFLAEGRTLEESVQLANRAGGIVVGKFGTAVVTREELFSSRRGVNVLDRKILRDRDLEGVVSNLRRDGKRIVFTNGCFDVLHAGHIDYLTVARGYGDCLIVGVNSDASVTRLKGPERPVQALEDRMKILAGLESVNFVIPFSSDTPKNLIQRITPQVLIKGEDWKDKGVVGARWVESHGGLVVLARMTPGRSTTNILQKVRKKKARKARS